MSSSSCWDIRNMYFKLPNETHYEEKQILNESTEWQKIQGNATFSVQNESLTILLALEVLRTLHSLLQIWAEVRVHSWHSSWVTHIKLITFYRTFILQIKRDMSHNMVHCSHYMCSLFSSHLFHSHPVWSVIMLNIFVYKKTGRTHKEEEEKYSVFVVW